MEDKPKFIWEGAVGAKIRERKNNSTGETFCSFEFVRCYKTPESDEMKYSSTFTDRNFEALGRLMKKIALMQSSGDDAVESHAEPTFQPLARIQVAQVPASEAKA